jgi:hypothetical protein
VRSQSPAGGFARAAAGAGVELRVRGHRVAASIAVGGTRGAVTPPTLPRLLATGDSTMQGIDNFLADDMSGVATVRSAVRPGTAISKLDPWALPAARDTRRQRQDVSVISIGANDAWPMTTPAAATVTCCGDPWVAEYGVRVRAMIRVPARRPRTLLLLTLPVPRDRAACRSSPPSTAPSCAPPTALAGSTVVRMDLLFSPHGYQDVIRHRGGDVHVRGPDGIHLNVPGTAIAATGRRQVARTALRAAAKR